MSAPESMTGNSWAARLLHEYVDAVADRTEPHHLGGEQRAHHARVEETAGPGWAWSVYGVLFSIGFSVVVWLVLAGLAYELFA
jgi:hypothetical protein